MYRGTTPAFTFKLPFAAANVTKLSILFRQAGGAELEKALEDCSVDGDTLTCSLSEDETLLLKDGLQPLAIQLRAGVGDKRMASQIWTVPIGRILKDGAL